MKVLESPKLVFGLIIRPDALWKIDFIKKKKKGKTSILVFCKRMQYCENELSRLLQNREIAIFGARQNRTDTTKANEKKKQINFNKITLRYLYIQVQNF